MAGSRLRGPLEPIRYTNTIRKGDVLYTTGLLLHVQQTEIATLTLEFWESFSKESHFFSGERYSWSVMQYYIDNGDLWRADQAIWLATVLEGRWDGLGSSEPS